MADSIDDRRRKLIARNSVLVAAMQVALDQSRELMAMPMPEAEAAAALLIAMMERLQAETIDVQGEHAKLMAEASGKPALRIVAKP